MALKNGNPHARNLEGKSASVKSEWPHRSVCFCILFHPHELQYRDYLATNSPSWAARLLVFCISITVGLPKTVGLSSMVGLPMIVEQHRLRISCIFATPWLDYQGRWQQMGTTRPNPVPQVEMIGGRWNLKGTEKNRKRLQWRNRKDYKRKGKKSNAKAIKELLAKAEEAKWKKPEIVGFLLPPQSDRFFQLMMHWVLLIVKKVCRFFGECWLENAITLFWVFVSVRSWQELPGAY